MTRLLLACALALLATDASAQGLPDLRGEFAIQLATERGFPGDALGVPISAANSGNAPAPDFQAAVYLSRYPVPNAEAVFLDRVMISGINPQSNGGSGTTVTLPDVPRGGYYLLAALDDPDTVAESDETNNVNIGRFTMRPVLDGPDLLVSTGTLEDTQAAPGDRVSVEFRAANRGRSAVGDFSVGYYLSTDIYSSPDDVLMERETLGGLDADETEDESDQVTVPANTPPGDYSFIIVLDDQNAVAERNEMNNTFRFFLRVTGTTAGEAVPGTEALGLRVSPNPSTAGARVALRLDAGTEARIVVIDALGRTVAVLADARLGAGEASFGVPALPPGVYVVAARVGAETRTQRFTVVR